MRVSKKLIRGYLRYLTSIELEDVEDPLADMSVFHSSIDAMAHAAQTDGMSDTLQLSLNFMISNPSDTLPDFRGSGYPFAEGELVAILDYTCRRIWPDDPVSNLGEAMPVEFVAEADL